MRERINRLARGILNFDQPVLSVQPESLALSVRRGEVLRTEISVNSANGFPIKGLIYSDHVRVRILRPSFGGQKNQLAVEADARFLDAGDEISGKFSLVTDGGETELPFCFTVTEGPAEEALQRLESLSAFAEIARQDPEAALRIFEYKNFPMAHFMRDLRLTALYEAFRKGPDRESALEEFLVAAGAKKAALKGAFGSYRCGRAIFALPCRQREPFSVLRAVRRRPVNLNGEALFFPLRSIAPHCIREKMRDGSASARRRAAFRFR